MPDCAVMGVSPRRYSRPPICDPPRSAPDFRPDSRIMEPPQLSVISRSRRRRRRSVSLGSIRQPNPVIPGHPKSSRSISPCSRRPLPDSDLMVLGHIPQNSHTRIMTPPSSSQVTVDAVVLNSPATMTTEDPDLDQPISIHEAVDRIKRFYSAGVLEPLQMKVTDELYDHFLDARETAGHSHPLYKMR